MNFQRYFYLSLAADCLKFTIIQFKVFQQFTGFIQDSYNLIL
nr:MAG TPA: hypothetical protein [Bacteriophage sp.]DAP63885.1 MAG TPA: hypothetical protein [Caudoviricetes sp.]DAS25745.1 MAG TPA: hypothetical protein [Caudoviricetes sp.]DAW93562.1 MAG TPA: hypothetical protein [Bacteriophage sp.]